MGNDFIDGQILFAMGLRENEDWIATLRIFRLNCVAWWGARAEELTAGHHGDSPLI